MDILHFLKKDRFSKRCILKTILVVFLFFSWHHFYSSPFSRFLSREIHSPEMFRVGGSWVMIDVVTFILGGGRWSLKGETCITSCIISENPVKWSQKWNLSWTGIVLFTYSPKTDISPENWCLEDYFHFKMVPFQGISWFSGEYWFICLQSHHQEIVKVFFSSRCFSWWETGKTGWQVSQNDAWTYFLDGNDLSRFHLCFSVVGILDHIYTYIIYLLFMVFFCCILSPIWQQVQTKKTLCETYDTIFTQWSHQFEDAARPMGLDDVGDDDFLQDFRSNKQRNTNMNTANTANMSEIAKAHGFSRKLFVVSRVSYKPIASMGLVYLPTWMDNFYGKGRRKTCHAWIVCAMISG